MSDGFEYSESGSEWTVRQMRECKDRIVSRTVDSTYVYLEKVKANNHILNLGKTSVPYLS